MFNFQVYGINLFSENCIESCKIYEKAFGFKILFQSLNHAELEINQWARLIFSKNSEHCKIDSGSFTLKLKELNIDSLKTHLNQFNLETYYPEKQYASFLDHYGNRIWIYESQD